MDNNIEFKVNKNLFIIALCVVIGILVAYIVLNAISGGSKAPTVYNAPVETNQNSQNPVVVVPVVPTEPDYTIASDTTNSDMNVFSSKKLGISFKYLKYLYSFDENNPGIDKTHTVNPPVIAEGTESNKVNLSSTGNSYLMVFKKDQGQSLEAAIKAQFLVNVPTTKCLTSRVYSGADDAFYTPTNQISFVRLNEISAGGCPSAFDFKNPSAAFFSFSNQPDKFFYIIGEADNTVPLTISTGYPFITTITSIVQ